MIPCLYFLGELHVWLARIQASFSSPLLYNIFLQSFLLRIDLPFIVNTGTGCLLYGIGLSYFRDWKMECMAFAIWHARWLTGIVLMEGHKGSKVSHACCLLSVHHVIVWWLWKLALSLRVWLLFGFCIARVLGIKCWLRVYIWIKVLLVLLLLHL